MKLMSKKEVSTYSCFEEKWKREYNPIKFIKRYGRNIKHAYQRIKYGYCDRDVWSIDSWFLNVIPNMLEDLKESTHVYPSIPSEISQAIVGTGAPSEVDDYGMSRWKNILSEMIFFFREANKDTCTKKNPYEEEYDKAFEKFEKKYGFLGDGLKTDEEKAEEEKKGLYRIYMLSDVPEYKEISDLHFAEERKIDEYRYKCKDKGMDLFKEWFWNLWD